MSNIEQIKIEIKTFQEETKTKNKAFFQKAVSSLFETYPILEQFSWQQYTPYFCDGDPCEFGVHSDVEVNGDETSIYGYERRIQEAKNINKKQLEEKLYDLKTEKIKAVEKEDFRKASDLKDKIEEVEFELNENLINLQQFLKAKMDIREIMKCFEDDFFKSMFGDHKTVTVYKDRIETEIYDHD